MKKTSVQTVRITDELIQRVRESAAEDYRKQADQINYLLELGLKYRGAIRSVVTDNAQIDIEAIRGAQ